MNWLSAGIKKPSIKIARLVVDHIIYESMAVMPISLYSSALLPCRLTCAKGTW